MRSRIFGALPLVLSANLVGLTVHSSPQSESSRTALMGYADPLSVQPGQSVRFMVSCDFAEYRADIVRLIHGDINPKGPGFKEEFIHTRVSGEYPGRRQDLRAGSHVTVPDSPALRLSGSLTLQAWIAASTPQKGVQGIVTKWSPADRAGYGLFLDEDGSLALWLYDGRGSLVKVRTGRPLRASIPASSYRRGDKSSGIRMHQMVNQTDWYFVAATFDSETGKVVLYQEPVTSWPLEDTRSRTEEETSARSVRSSRADLLVAGYRTEDSVEGVFNGKLESPKIFDRALSRPEIEALKEGQEVAKPVAAWDFSVGISTRDVRDTSSNQLHGKTVQMPTRAVTGHNWTGAETNFRLAPRQYGAIYFHDDDLDDAGWEVDFEFRIPANLRSGVYAARLQSGTAEDYIPFFVRPAPGSSTAPIALLMPTFSYLAYGASGPPVLSLYSFHSDGSGVCHVSSRRPILNLRPKVVENWQGIDLVHMFNADLHLVDWLEAKGFRYDVITDGDLHDEGEELLSPYKVVITGSHPEYWSEQMLDGLQDYLSRGGRLMYLGGNGFYWVTSVDPVGGHTLEVRRKDGTQMWEAAPGEYYHSTTGELGGLWRFRGRPPQKLAGVGFTSVSALRPEPGRPFRRQPGSFNPRAAFIFEGIGHDEVIGDFPSLLIYGDYGAGGFEIDRLDHRLGTPPHALLLATASGYSEVYQHVVEEVMQADSMQSGSVNPWVRSDMVYFEHPNGGAVFSVGSIAWDASLSYNQYANNVSRITENVLTKFASDEWSPEDNSN